MKFRALISTFIGCMGLLLLGVDDARGESRPAWVDHPELHDSEFKHYIGRATHSPSDSDAVFLATSTARKQAISENYGTYVQFESEAFKTSTAEGNTVNTGQTAREISDQVRLKSFEQEEIYFERDSAGVSVWIDFRYPIAEINLEKKRLEKLQQNKDSIPKLRVFGSDETDEPTGMIEVHSYPEGLAVQVDTYSEMLGRKFITPFQYRGIPIGHHIVKITDPHFQLYQEEVSIQPGTQTTVNATMKAATASLTIKTSIDGATVSVGSKTYQSPTDPILISAGVPIQIQITHPEAMKTISDEVTANRNEDVVKNYEFKLKPALVSINSTPEGAKVFIDGEPKGTTPATIEVKAHESHSLSLTKESYDDLDTKIEPIPGGLTHIIREPFILEKNEVKPVEVTTSSRPNNERFHLIETSPEPGAISIRRDSVDSPIYSPNDSTVDALDNHFWLGVRMGGDSSSLKRTSNGSFYIGIISAWQPFWWIAFDLNGDIGAHPTSNSNQQVTMTKDKAEAGVFFQFLTFKSFRLVFGPQWITQSITDSTNKISANQYCIENKFGIDFLAGSATAPHPVLVRFDFGMGKVLKTTGTTDVPTSFVNYSVGFIWGL